MKSAFPALRLDPVDTPKTDPEPKGLLLFPLYGASKIEGPLWPVDVLVGFVVERPPDAVSTRPELACAGDGMRSSFDEAPDLTPKVVACLLPRLSLGGVANSDDPKPLAGDAAGEGQYFLTSSLSKYVLHMSTCFPSAESSILVANQRVSTSLWIDYSHSCPAYRLT